MSDEPQESIIMEEEEMRFSDHVRNNLNFAREKDAEIPSPILTEERARARANN